jgi:hypothetical protein
MAASVFVNYPWNVRAAIRAVMAAAHRSNHHITDPENRIDYDALLAALLSDPPIGAALAEAKAAAAAAAGPPSSHNAEARVDFVDRVERYLGSASSVVVRAVYYSCASLILQWCQGHQWASREELHSHWKATIPALAVLEEGVIHNADDPIWHRFLCAAESAAKAAAAAGPAVTAVVEAAVVAAEAAADTKGATAKAAAKAVAEADAASATAETAAAKAATPVSAHTYIACALICPVGPSEEVRAIVRAHKRGHECPCCRRIRDRKARLSGAAAEAAMEQKKAAIAELVEHGRAKGVLDAIDRILPH